MGFHAYFNVARSKRLGFQLGCAFHIIRFHKGKFYSTQLQIVENADFSINHFSIPVNLNIFLDKKQRIQV